MMPTILDERRERLEAKRKELAEIFEEAGEEFDFDKVKVHGYDGLPDTGAKLDDVRKRNTELNELYDAVKEAEEILGIRKTVDELDEVEHPGHPTKGKKQQQEEQEQTKSFGDLFLESKAYKERVSKGAGPEDELDIELKTLFTTAAGWAPPTIRGPRLVDFATAPVEVIDMIPQTTTGSTSIVYMEETTFTDAAVEVAEGGTKPEAALALTEKSSPVRKIAVWIPVTDEQLEDVSQVSGYLNNRLGFMVRRRLGTQILTGNGTAPNLRGILNVVGIQTQAKAADPTPDAFYKAMTKIMVTGQAVPNGIVMHPNDWQEIRLLRTADGLYIWGSPSDSAPARLWGLPVALAQAETEGTGIVGDFSFSELSIRKGVTVQISDSHSTFFIENKQAVRAEMRAAFVVYRPTAFCSVTGI